MLQYNHMYAQHPYIYLVIYCLDGPVLQSIRPLVPVAYRKHIPRISKESTAPPRASC